MTLSYSLLRAVSIMTGRCSVRGLARSRRRMESPSSSGSMMSRISSSGKARSMAS